jgi:hypothetical protein
MRLFKLILSIIVLAFISLFVWQNLSTFKTPLPFSLDLYARKMDWQHQLYTLLIGTFLVGFIGGLLLMLKPYFGARRLLAQERQERQQAAPDSKTAEAPPPPPKEEPQKES